MVLRILKAIFYGLVTWIVSNFVLIFGVSFYYAYIGQPGIRFSDGLSAAIQYGAMFLGLVAGLLTLIGKKGKTETVFTEAKISSKVPETPMRGRFSGAIPVKPAIPSVMPKPQTPPAPPISTATPFKPFSLPPTPKPSVPPSQPPVFVPPIAPKPIVSAPPPIIAPRPTVSVPPPPPKSSVPTSPPSAFPQSRFSPTPVSLPTPPALPPLAIPRPTPPAPADAFSTSIKPSELSLRPPVSSPPNHPA